MKSYNEKNNDTCYKSDIFFKQLYNMKNFGDGDRIMQLE